MKKSLSYPIFYLLFQHILKKTKKKTKKSKLIIIIRGSETACMRRNKGHNKYIAMWDKEMRIWDSKVKFFYPLLWFYQGIMFVDCVLCVNVEQLVKLLDYGTDTA
jgi:hypothetical protein